MNIIRKLRYRYIAIGIVVSTLLILCAGVLYILSEPVLVTPQLYMICLQNPEGNGCKSCLEEGYLEGTLCELCEDSTVENETELPEECTDLNEEWSESDSSSLNVVVRKNMDTVVRPLSISIFVVGCCLNTILVFIAIVKYLASKRNH